MGLTSHEIRLYPGSKLLSAPNPVLLTAHFTHSDIGLSLQCFPLAILVCGSFVFHSTCLLHWHKLRTRVTIKIAVEQDSFSHPIKYVQRKLGIAGTTTEMRLPLF